ncbi:MAG: cobG [Actinomycetia bacterium]|nr:cobG [Actinomycetes bacterium]
MHETSPFTSRPAADRCPGVLRLAEAADGLLARVRLPGGLIDAAQLRVLARLAGELGDGRIELTSRGNVQVRGLAAGAASPLTSELIQAGLLPSLSHDRVRNVLASPLAGLDRGPDLTGVVRALDAALCVRPRLAELSGRFLFAVDDGRGDVAGLGADVVATIRTDGAVVNGLSVRGLRDAVVAAMIACAEAFLDRRAALGSSAWRIADLPGGAEPVRSVVAARLGLAAAQGEPIAGTPDARAAARPVGLVVRQETGGGAESAASVRDDPGFSAVLLAPLGRLTSAQVSWVADRVAGRAARITPWRSVVLPDLVDAAGVLREAAGLGFGTDEASPWLRVTACAGRPGCASALADVQADAAAFAARWPGRLVHVSGCARHCGRPAATEIDVTATSEGYQVAGV